MSTARLRIGIDTGGTFTDIVAPDAATGPIHSTKVPSTPANPAAGLVRGVEQIPSDSGHAHADLASLVHGTAIAANALLQGEIDSLGLMVTEGFRHLLEIGRQSVPQGYGNSYFWVLEEFGSTTGLSPGQTLRLDPRGIMIVTRR
ncbi:MAG: hydantoinase/oxoprolinase N-terminal domain-containing protein [Candidatus Binatia bacterium]